MTEFGFNTYELLNAYYSMMDSLTLLEDEMHFCSYIH